MLVWYRLVTTSSLWLLNCLRDPTVLQDRIPTSANLPHRGTIKIAKCGPKPVSNDIRIFKAHKCASCDIISVTTELISEGT